MASDMTPNTTPLTEAEIVEIRIRDAVDRQGSTWRVSASNRFVDMYHDRGMLLEQVKYLTARLARKDEALTANQRKLFRIAMAPWLAKNVTFEEWCEAVDELIPAKKVITNGNEE